MENSSFGLIAWPLRNEIRKDDSNHRTYINEETWRVWAKADPSNADVYNSYSALERFYAKQLNDGTTTFSANPLSDNYVQIVIWGTNSSGDLSGVFGGGYIDWSDTSTNGSRAATPLKSPKKPEANIGKLKYICGNINDINVIRIK